MDNNIGDRLKKLRKINNLSQKDFADILGIKEAVTISRWENGLRKPDYSILLKLSGIFNINLHWLLTGEGNSILSNNLQTNDEFKQIPFIDIKASAGGGYFNFNGNIESYFTFKKEWLHLNIGTNYSHLFLMEVEGDSMEPTILDGDLIMVDKSLSKVEKDGIYVIMYNNVTMVKRVQLISKNSDYVKLKIISDNKLYGDFDVELAEQENFRILGKVLWFGRKL